MQNQLHQARRKMSHVIDEIYTALLRSGSQEVTLRILREPGGLRLLANSDFAAEHRANLARMGEVLQPAIRNSAMVEEFWALAGGDQYTSDSELTLVGQMVTEVDFQLGDTTLELKLFVPFQN